MENNYCKTIDKSFDIQFLEQTHFASQKIKHAKKKGVGHWDRECPYPYGNEELHVTCKMCSIDLEMYKLAEIMFPKNIIQ